MKIVSNTKKHDKLTVYDVTVDQAHHYILENGVVSHNSYVPTKSMSGGSGLKYCASQIIFLSKKKDKDGTEVVGNIIKCKTDKSRFTKENKVVEVKLHYDTGLDRHYGLLELAEKHGVIKKVSTRYELPDGSKVFGKAINSNPQKYFTEEIMEQLNAAAKKEFTYGAMVEEDIIEVDDDV